MLDDILSDVEHTKKADKLIQRATHSLISTPVVLRLVN